MHDERGIAMTIVVMTILLLTLVAGSVLTVGYHQRLLSRSVDGKMKAFYWAHAGLVDAQERIRRNPAPFNNPTYNDPPYTLDLDGALPLNDVTVDIGPESTTAGPTYGLRTVVVVGRE